MNDDLSEATRVIDKDDQILRLQVQVLVQVLDLLIEVKRLSARVGELENRKE